METTLGLFERRNTVCVSSRIVAENFGKEHRDVVRAIDNKIENLTAQNCAVKTDVRFEHKDYFIESTFDHNGNKYREYLLTRDGFCFIVMGFTGKEADIWKLKYISAFNAMESALRERQSTDWLQTRERGKLIRREETDVIQRLIPYAEAQGSQNAKMFYLNYSNLVNKAARLESGQRREANYKTLMTVSLMEDMIQRTIAEEMERGVYYKEIYKLCKSRVEQFSQLIAPPKGGFLVQYQ